MNVQQNEVKKPDNSIYESRYQQRQRDSWTDRQKDRATRDRKTDTETAIQKNRETY